MLISLITIFFNAISNGNDVDLSALNQSLTLSGNTLSLSDGNSVDLAALESSGISPVFITNVNNNNGLLQDSYIQGTIPSDKIVSAITVDDDSNLDVTIEWDGPTDEWMGKVYNFLGVSTGCITNELDDVKRKKNYRICKLSN